MSQEVVPRFRNYYRCEHTGTQDEGQVTAEWEDTWDAMCNDECPVCSEEIAPYKSEDLIPAEAFKCRGCGRDEEVCSEDPCPGVIADRAADDRPSRFSQMCDSGCMNDIRFGD